MTSRATTWGIETRRDAEDFLKGDWHRQPQTVGIDLYTDDQLRSWTSAQVIDHARDVMRRILEAEQQQEPQPEASRTIKMEMTWAYAAQIIAAALENGTGAGREAARAELFRMAGILDTIRLNDQQEHDT